LLTGTPQGCRLGLAGTPVAPISDLPRIADRPVLPMPARIGWRVTFLGPLASHRPGKPPLQLLQKHQQAEPAFPGRRSFPRLDLCEDAPPTEGGAPLAPEHARSPGAHGSSKVDLHSSPG